MILPTPFAKKSNVLSILVPDELKNSIVKPDAVLFVIKNLSPDAIFWPEIFNDGLDAKAEL